jgi:hypothetical protein
MLLRFVIIFLNTILFYRRVAEFAELRRIIKIYSLRSQRLACRRAGRTYIVFFTLPIPTSRDFPSLQACREGIKGWFNFFLCPLWFIFYFNFHITFETTAIPRDSSQFFLIVVLLPESFCKSIPRMNTAQQCGGHWEF